MKMMKLNLVAVFFIVVAIITTTIQARSIAGGDEDNSLSVSSSNNPKPERNDFVKISKAPPATVIQPAGSIVEIECEVVGSPIPIVQWVHGSGQYVNFDDIETNIISESDPTVMTTVRARLVIDHQIQSERTFTCVAKSGSKTVYASTTVHKGPRHLVKQHNFTDLLMTNANLFGGLRPVRITHYFKSVLALMGSNLIIPCKTIGRPRAEITWLDTEDNVITGQEPRYKTLPTGELLISDLKWSDMGSYTCVAKNGIAKDTISSFIYPLRND